MKRANATNEGTPGVQVKMETDDSPQSTNQRSITPPSATQAVIMDFPQVCRGTVGYGSFEKGTPADVQYGLSSDLEPYA